MNKFRGEILIIYKIYTAVDALSNDEIQLAEHAWSNPSQIIKIADIEKYFSLKNFW